MTRPRGLTLVEVLVGLVVAGVVAAAASALLLAGSRLAAAESAELAVRQNAWTGAAVLRAELEEVSVSAGDLLAATDSTVTLRALRAFGVACATPAESVVALDDARTSLVRAIDPARDSALVFVEDDPRLASDDRWHGAAVTAVSTGTCPSGGAATVVALSAPWGSGSVTRGAPVRVFEVQEYRSYRDASGRWWLGVRGPAAGGGWQATSPIAGPLSPGDGLSFVFLDSLGLAAGAGAVRQAEAGLVVVSEAALPGARAAPVDSMRVRIALTP